MPPNDSNDHDLLVKVSRDMDWMKEALKGHLQRHWAVSLAAITAMIFAGVSLVLVLFKTHS